MEEKMITVYGLLPKTNLNEIKYVGVTRKKTNLRFSDHIYDAKKYPNKNKRTRWLSSINFQIDYVELDIVPEEDWLFWERYWVAQMKSWGFDLVNSNNGGGGTGKRGEENSKWLSKRNKGNKYHLGHKHSDETRAIISKKRKNKPSNKSGKKLTKIQKNNLTTKFKKGVTSLRKGVKLSEETLEKVRVPIIQFSLDGGLIKEWKGISEAAKSLNMNTSPISNNINTKTESAGGFIWKRKYKDRFNHVLQYDLNDNFLKEWESAAAAERELKIFDVGKNCSNKSLSAGGYKWKYKKRQ